MKKSDEILKRKINSFIEGTISLDSTDIEGLISDNVVHDLDEWRIKEILLSRYSHLFTEEEYNNCLLKLGLYSISYNK
jgi:hypothetical protein